MSKVIGIASEGPTDYLVLKAVIDKITGEENRYLPLQPEADMMGRYGNGWKGVWKWCKETVPLDIIMDSIQPRIDIVVIQMDGDVVRKEKEVHCLCDSTRCDIKGEEFPLYCKKTIARICPIKIPCHSHSDEIGDIVMRSNLSSAAFGGEGLFNLCLEGNGLVVLNSPCPKEELYEIILQNDVVKIDGNHAVCWSKSLEFTVEKSGKSLIGSAASGEGLVNVYRGSGKILMSPLC